MYGYHGYMPNLHKVTVNLTKKSFAALDAAAARSGDSKTDTVNRALQMYAYLEQVTGGAAQAVTESSLLMPARRTLNR